MAYSYVSDQMVDEFGPPPDLLYYTFKAVSAAVTLTGIFVDIYGNQVGASIIGAITTGAATNLFTLNGGAVPPTGAGNNGSNKASGFIGQLSGAVYMGLGGKLDGTITTATDANCPQIAAGTIKLGRVSKQIAESFGATSTIPVQGSVQRMTAGAAAPGQSLKSFSSSGGVSINTGLTSNVYTVTAGKTLYLTDFDISTDSGTAFLVQLKAGGVTIAEKFISTTAAWEMVGIESQIAVGTGVLLTIVAPTVAGKNLAYIINGFEQ